VLLEGSGLHGAVGAFALRLLLAPVKLGGDNAGISGGLRDGDAWFEAAGEGEGVAVAADVGERCGREDIDPSPRGEDSVEVESGGKDADNGGGGVVERDGFADDASVGVEVLFPEGIGEQDNGAAWD